MAYKILYGPVKHKRTPHPKGRLFLLTLCFFALFALAACQLAPAQLTALRQILFPQNQVDALLKELQDGKNIADAVSAFCREIFNGK